MKVNKVDSRNIFLFHQRNTAQVDNLLPYVAPIYNSTLKQDVHLANQYNQPIKHFKEVRSLSKYIIVADYQVEPLVKSNNIGRGRGSAIVQT